MTWPRILLALTPVAVSSIRQFMCVVAALVVIQGGVAHAAEKSLLLNFDTQLVRIFEEAQTARELRDDHIVSKADHDALRRILGKLKDHKMLLKNVVYRTDMAVIRVTWADDANQDIIKVAYKTGKDPILGNSVYADKNNVIDVKILYMSGGKDYHYLHLQNMQNTANTPPPVSKPAGEFRIEGSLTNEKCRFCHILAKNDHSPSGLFFLRYQEGGNDNVLQPQSLFHIDHFTHKTARDAASLGLPNMSEDFLYQKVNLGPPDTPDENYQFVRTIIELPQLVEVMARDNNQSICVASNFGILSTRTETSINDYACADNKAQRLYVRLTNSHLTMHDGPHEYSEPYYEKK